MRPVYWFVAIALGAGLVALLFSGESGTTLGIDTDIFGNTLYLGLFGAVVAAGILGSGIAISQAAKNLAIWMALLLLLVGGYQYRYELQDVASRVTAGLIPGSRSR